MGIEALNHFTINAADLEATRAFHEQVLALGAGDRPPRGFPGYWRYAGGRPIVHLVGLREGEAGKPARKPGPTGLFDHIAFTTTGLAAQRERLVRHKLEFAERVVPRDGQTQLFLHDPNGIGVELNFPPGDR